MVTLVHWVVLKESVNERKWWRHSTQRRFCSANLYYRYKTAEACSTRLSEMSHSLTDMIDEINLSSNKLSNNSSSNTAANQDDPLAQIVRVLNSHLSQLQKIDEGAKDLGKKVESAQQEARVLGQRQSVNGAGWVESFGRSYLGR